LLSDPTETNDVIPLASPLAFKPPNHNPPVTDGNAVGSLGTGVSEWRDPSI